MTVPGAGLGAKVRAMGDNLISRLVGFSIRLIVLFVAILAMATFSIVGCIQIISWPLIPAAIIFCLYKGLAG